LENNGQGAGAENKLDWPNTIAHLVDAPHRFQTMSRAMRRDKPAFIFVHGGFVDGSIWQLVISRLEAQDHVAQALDLLGSGVSAKAPLAYGKRPLDAAAFATEPSPNANVTQEERTQTVVSLVEETARETGGPLRRVSIGDLSMMVLRYGAEIVAHPEPLEGFVLLQFVLSARRRSASTGRRSPVAARAAYRAGRFERVGY
jgi:hypothetical protein